ncbi:MAG TPA: epoxyqueuosine reductase [Dehalococcoidia bacterium]|nr:epoxyqueuosine reductase [Dehalococcoidia bacterium]
MLHDELSTFLKSQGAALTGFADLHEIPPDLRDNFPCGVSIAVALNPEIVAGIADGPNQPYFEEYRRANQLLGILGDRAARFLEQKGYQASSFAATNAGIDPDTFSTRLPHKTVATRAGLGWIGKCALLVTPEYGSAIRLTTVLTDADLPAGKPVNASQCSDCTACVDVCPGHAVTGRDWQLGMPRESLYDFSACRETALDFEKKRKMVRDSICGMCIAACPWTIKYLKRAG